MNAPFVLAITGASGAAYACRLLQLLRRTGRTVHFTASESAAVVLKQELGIEFDADNPDVENLSPYSNAVQSGSPLWQTLCKTWREEKQDEAEVIVHHFRDFLTPIASGSFLTAGMVICPCSGSTLGAIAGGTGNNLIQRAADVHLKERRKLILVTRETPLGLVQLENMRRCHQAGAVVLPASPGWYHGVETIADLVDFVVARILDQLGLEGSLIRRWQEK